MGRGDRRSRGREPGAIVVPERPAIRARRADRPVRVRLLLLVHAPLRHEHEQLDCKPLSRLRREQIQRLLLRRRIMVTGAHWWRRQFGHRHAWPFRRSLTIPSEIAALGYSRWRPSTTDAP